MLAASHSFPRCFLNPTFPPPAQVAVNVTMTLQAWRTVLTIIGGQYFERWPDEEKQAFLFADLYTYPQRLDIGTFLYGNVRNANLVYEVMRPQIGADPRDHDHTRRFLADLASGRYRDRYHYFDVRRYDWHLLSGELNTRRAPPNPFVRELNAWEDECARLRRTEGRWPSMAEQHAFLGI